MTRDCKPQLFATTGYLKKMLAKPEDREPLDSAKNYSKLMKNSINDHRHPFMSTPNLCSSIYNNLLFTAAAITQLRKVFEERLSQHNSLTTCHKGKVIKKNMKYKRKQSVVHM